MRKIYRLQIESGMLISASQEVITADNASLWFSGKEMHREKILSDYVGRNDKTKIIAKLSKRGTGAPAREPIVNEEQQRAIDGILL
ncbi:uncharacterized protein DC041_0008941 [Schistosoma bovis]|uniref:Uncharacterized protein n=1 Tax=Schistosoma bovis TaxID=6184 RepID=A0A430QU68_SCHBO|nr:uncharacterized protein DC041_0008941 [Schistosoma bovis]